MFLKRLDIIGFKSFPDRIRLEFQPGLTAVVGPNGSGKSNIADAVRWVMGEQSVKSLRGAKMEDVIFSGTEHRRPLGYAEVVMTVDNADRALPMAFNEIAVTRRVYRSGESEYAINGVPCRLKDVQMLFMDTGVGREGYSIIGQGRIDEILSVRSEDRRLLFEEAAGIGKFKTRRHEALGKLEREQQNLTRVNDIIDELAAQMEPLSRQAEQAKIWLALREQYKTAHINVFLEEAQHFQTELVKIEAALSDISAQAQEGQSLLTETRSAGEMLKRSLASHDTRYKLAHERLVGLVAAMEQKESDIKLLEAQRIHAQNDRERLEQEIHKREEAAAHKQAEWERENAERDETEQALAALEARLAERQDDINALDEAMRAREQALDGYNRAVMEQITLSAELKARVREAENLYERLEEDKERINSEILHNETMLAAETERRSKAAQALADTEQEIEKQQAMITAYEQERARLAAELAEQTTDYRRIQAELQECVSRHKVLAELERHHEGYYRSVKAILRKKEEDAHYAGICGAVGELIGVPRVYETAVEIALGGAAQNIVTQTEDDAKRAISFLKVTREGRATFLPLTAVTGRELDAEKRGITQEPGFVGVASALVSHEPVYAPVIAHLLGGVVVMDTLDHALAVHKKYRYTLKIVTLEGELLSPGGALTGGSASKSGLIGRGRQLAECAEKLAEWKAAEAASSGLLREQESKWQSTDSALSRARAYENTLLLERNDTANRLSQTEERLTLLQNTAVSCGQENERLMAKLVETNAAVRAAKKEWAKQEETVHQTRAQMEDYQNRMVNERELKDEKGKSLTELRLEIVRRTESRNQSQSNLNRLARERDALQAEREVLRREQATGESTAAQHLIGIQQAQEALTHLKAELAEQHSELAVIEQDKSDLDEAIRRAEADERLRMDEAARLNQEIARLEMRKDQLDTDSRRLYDEIWDEYGLTYQTAAVFKRMDMSGASLRREVKRLKAELAPFTDVNVGAVEAYKQLKTRYDFLTAQRNDIHKAEEDLRAVIDTLTQQMEHRFTEQFMQISKHFSDVFQEMFGGGKAGLHLLDEAHILESGIEITAQPPGKSLQTLSLLSGGERALTAIALLFGILRMKPSPFCVLDEIEAALDDANVLKFAKFLQQYTGETQFIIITHRKGTMEAADTLYGVTMQEQGISKLVSVKFTEDEYTGGAHAGS